MHRTSQSESDPVGFAGFLSLTLSPFFLRAILKTPNFNHFWSRGQHDLCNEDVHAIRTQTSEKTPSM